jgi:hypothetical protein
MTDVNIRGSTNQAVPGGYKGTDGRGDPNTLAHLSNLDKEHGGNAFWIAPLAIPGPESQWISKYSNQSKGRPQVETSRMIKEDLGPQMSFKTVTEQFTQKHQKGYAATNVGVHGLQWYDVTQGPSEMETIQVDDKKTNWEASRFIYARAEVPTRMGYDLKGSTATLQRGHSYITTGSYRHRGSTRGGYSSGMQGIKAKVNIYDR